MTSEPTPIGTPVRDLQAMLRIVTNVYREIPFLVLDGQFGEKTLEAVMRFQQLASLPVTGIVDQLTWDTLLNERDRVQRQLTHPRPAAIFPHSEAIIRQGQSSPLLYPIQGMLLGLADIFVDVETAAISGVLDEATSRNLKWIQQKGHRQETGDLDRETWELLSRIYETFITRQHQS